MLVLTLFALSLPYPSPANAGIQSRADRTWAPAFAGEEKKGDPAAGSSATDPKDMTPIDAERAFAADAKAIGQWTAFRKWSTDDAVMFVPQPTNAHDFLKDRKDPPKVIDWWPTASWMSCDGNFAVNTGGWLRPDGAVGFFSTVWAKQPDGGWKWIADGGDSLTTARDRPSEPRVVRASCKGQPPSTGNKPDDKEIGGDIAPDRTLGWAWRVKPDGSRTFVASFWNGSEIALAIKDEIAANK